MLPSVKCELWGAEIAGDAESLYPACCDEVRSDGGGDVGDGDDAGGDGGGGDGDGVGDAERIVLKGANHEG